MLPALNSVNHRLYTYKNFSFSDIKKKEVLRMKHLYSFVCPICLGKADSLRRTNTCACAALCASISINHVALCTLQRGTHQHMFHKKCNLHQLRMP